MNCPRCKSPIGPLKNPDAIVTCPGCGTRLMTRSAALRSQGGASPQGTAPAPPASPPQAPARSAQQTSVKVGVRQTTVSGSKTAGGGSRAGSRKAAASASAVTLEMVLAEIRGLRETQQQILDALSDLRAGQAQAAIGSSTADGMAETGSELSPIRTGSQKSVVLVDDDVQTRNAAVRELEQSEIPVRAFGAGQTALAAIAEDKPAVIILELGVGGDVGGKDLVNMIKATMEWVDIRIVLWTREPVSNQKEARQIHGADEVVAKSSGAAALVARVIQVLRR